MDLHKLAHDLYEATKHWHLPIFTGLLGSFKAASKINARLKMSGLGEVPGDNILPKEILISLASRRGPGARL